MNPSLNPFFDALNNLQNVFFKNKHDLEYELAQLTLEFERKREIYSAEEIKVQNQIEEATKLLNQKASAQKIPISYLNSIISANEEPDHEFLPPKDDSQGKNNKNTSSFNQNSANLFVNPSMNMNFSNSSLKNLVPMSENLLSTTNPSSSVVKKDNLETPHAEHYDNKSEIETRNVEKNTKENESLEKPATASKSAPIPKIFEEKKEKPVIIDGNNAKTPMDIVVPDEKEPNIAPDLKLQQKNVVASSVSDENNTNLHSTTLKIPIIEPKNLNLEKNLAEKSKSAEIPEVKVKEEPKRKENTINLENNENKKSEKEGKEQKSIKIPAKDEKKVQISGKPEKNNSKSSENPNKEMMIIEEEKKPHKQVRATKRKFEEISDEEKEEKQDQETKNLKLKRPRRESSESEPDNLEIIPSDNEADFSHANNPKNLKHLMKERENLPQIQKDDDHLSPNDPKTLLIHPENGSQEGIQSLYGFPMKRTNSPTAAPTKPKKTLKTELKLITVEKNEKKEKELEKEKEKGKKKKSLLEIIESTEKNENKEKENEKELEKEKEKGKKKKSVLENIEKTEKSEKKHRHHRHHDEEDMDKEKEKSKKNRKSLSKEKERKHETINDVLHESDDDSDMFPFKSPKRTEKSSKKKSKSESKDLQIGSPKKKGLPSLHRSLSSTSFFKSGISSTSSHSTAPPKKSLSSMLFEKTRSFTTIPTKEMLEGTKFEPKKPKGDPTYVYENSEYDFIPIPVDDDEISEDMKAPQQRQPNETEKDGIGPMKNNLSNENPKETKQIDQNQQNNPEKPQNVENQNNNSETSENYQPNNVYSDSDDADQEEVEKIVNNLGRNNQNQMHNNENSTNQQNGNDNTSNNCVTTIPTIPSIPNVQQQNVNFQPKNAPNLVAGSTIQFKQPLTNLFANKSKANSNMQKTVFVNNQTKAQQNSNKIMTNNNIANQNTNQIQNQIQQRNDDRVALDLGTTETFQIGTNGTEQERKISYDPREYQSMSPVPAIEVPISYSLPHSQKYAVNNQKNSNLPTNDKIPANNSKNLEQNPKNIQEAQPEEEQNAFFQQKKLQQQPKNLNPVPNPKKNPEINNGVIEKPVPSSKHQNPSNPKAKKLNMQPTAYVSDPIRNKKDRALLHGKDCECCKPFFEVLKNTPGLQISENALDQAQRHKVSPTENKAFDCPSNDINDEFWNTPVPGENKSKFAESAPSITTTTSGNPNFNNRNQNNNSANKGGQNVNQNNQNHRR